jgi:hypothetical protein
MAYGIYFERLIDQMMDLMLDLIGRLAWHPMLELSLPIQRML